MKFNKYEALNYLYHNQHMVYNISSLKLNKISNGLNSYLDKNGFIPHGDLKKFIHKIKEGCFNLGRK